MDRITRRAFLNGLACASAAGVFATEQMAEGQSKTKSKNSHRNIAKGATKMLPIIDTHQHLWDLSKFHLPWIKPGAPLASSHLVSDYKHATDGLNVVGTVYMEVDVAPEQRAKEAEYVFGLCRTAGSGLVGAVIGGNPLEPGFKEYVQRFAQDPHSKPYFKGVRQVLHGGLPQGTCLKPEFIAGMDVLAEYGLVYDLCLRPAEVTDGAELARLCPNNRFVLDHCGNAPIYSAAGKADREAWKKGVAEIAQLPNVVCKISGIIAQLKKGDSAVEHLAPSINYCIQHFGHDRIMFAGDWPVCTLGSPLKGWIGALKEIVHTWPEADQRKLFHDNAHRFYNLSV